MARGEGGRERDGRRMVRGKEGEKEGKSNTVCEFGA